MAIKPICKIEGCGKSTYSKRGWCLSHFRRWKRHGDPNAGKTPNGKPLKFYREVVLVYEGDECLAWPYSRNARGYGQIRYAGRASLVSRLVCEAAHGPAPTPDHEAAHGCGKGTEGCVTKSHLSWKSHAKNMADMVIHGTSNRGARNPNTILTETEVREIIALKDILTQQEIANYFCTSQSNVSTIQAKKNWGWLGKA